MLSLLKNHPFAVEAFFERSLVLSFAVPKEQVQQLIPACLEPDSFNKQWAFVAIALVPTRGLRPKGFPKFLGNDFFLIGYRVFVRYTSNTSKRLRGLYILKSETDKRKMEFVGNIFTHYNYTTTDITQILDGNILEIESTRSNFYVKIALTNGHTDLPAGSPFPDWKMARKFAGPLPFTFTYDPHTNKVLIIEGVRQHWVPEPVSVIDYRFPFLTTLHLDNPVLANAFVVNQVPYHWKKGKSEKWEGRESHSRALSILSTLTGIFMSQLRYWCCY